jgi:hypothetical protein
MRVERDEGRREINERRMCVHRRDAARRGNYRRDYARRTIMVMVSVERRSVASRRTNLRRAGVDRRRPEGRRDSARRLSFERRKAEA